MGVNQYEDQLAQMNGAFEPQRQYQWTLSIVGLEGSDVIEMALRTAALPSTSSDEIELPFMNSRVYVAGKRSYENGSIALNDFVDKNTAAIIHKWDLRVFDPETGGQGYAKDYKKSGLLVLYDPPLKDSRIWELRGIWPQAINYGSLDYSASDGVQIELTLRYDKAIALFL